MKANKFTREQHAEHGDALKAATDATVMIQVMLSNCYGRTCRERMLAEKANTALLRLRSAMDSLVCAELPADRDACRLYFGQRVANSTPVR